MLQHFLQLSDLGTTQILALLERAGTLKAQPLGDSLQGRTLAMLFMKSSTRTRVSFETGMAQLGGHALFLSPDHLHLGRGEPLEDTARVISSMVDAIMIRGHEHEQLQRFAESSSVPLINGLSAAGHPCQLLADLMTWQERLGTLEGCVAWVGDGNNVCASWLEAAALFGFEIRIACPEHYEPDAQLVQRANAQVVRDPFEAVSGARVVNTDTWLSMGDTDKKEREQAFQGYQVNAKLMQEADADAILLHCLPAYRGNEVDANIMDAPCSAVWQQAENRLHAQKALLEFLIQA